MPGNNCVYGLVDPDTLEVRYVGITTKSIQERLERYIYNCECGDQNHLYRWMRQLKTAPSIVILEKDCLDLFQSEKRWIATLRSEGANLTNMTDGGDGTLGYVFTEEVKARMSQAALERWSRPEELEKISRAGMGRIVSNETRAKHSLALMGNTRFAGHHWTPEAIARRNANMLMRGTSNAGKRARVKVV